MLNINELRKEYRLKSLRRNELVADPFAQFEKWFQEALQAVVPEPNAMCLATATLQGEPSSRTVLLKGKDQRGYYFFTSFESRKSRDLDANPRACATFYWKELERQVIISGDVEKLLQEESEKYFLSRPRGSRLAVWASHQDQVLSSRDDLEKHYKHFEKKFEGKEVPKPDYWGGYRIVPLWFEFWQGRPNRLHDRFRYTRAVEGDLWLIERLSP